VQDSGSGEAVIDALRPIAQQLVDHRERVYDSALSAITDFVYVFDLEGRFTYANKALLDLLGLSLGEIVGLTFLELEYPKPLAQRLQSQIRAVIDSKKRVTDETVYTNSAGKSGFYEYIFSPVFGSSGGVELVAGSTREVTDRKQNENELLLHHAQFETLLNEAPLGVYLVDGDFRIRSVNPAARAVFGNIPGLIGRDFDEVIHILWPRPYADELVSVFRHTLLTGEAAMTSERVERRLDLHEVEFYEWQVSRIPLHNGEYGVVCYFRDISGQIDVRRRLERADQQKNEFLAMLAHELRNPIAPIRNATELLSRVTVPNTASATAIGVIKRQVTQLARLVDDLLDVARIEQGQVELKRRPTILADVVILALETVSPLFEEKQQKISITSDYQFLKVNADAARLVQCVGNILTNAAKYTDPAGEILISTRVEGGVVVLAITDNGIGISPETLPTVFDLFVQSDRTLDRARGGLGIGLSLVKRLIDLHGGEVSVSSPGLGKGSTFEIRLPSIDKEEGIVVAGAQTKAPPRRLLIVDDNADSADSLALLLQLDGHEACVAYDGTSALGSAADFKPDFVLLDIGLPDMDGYEVAGRIRLLPGLAAVRIIALTGLSGRSDRDHIAAVGFDSHLIKPIDFVALEEMLAAHRS
jgi:PAS domain S-box-containing protein